MNKFIYFVSDFDGSKSCYVSNFLCALASNLQPREYEHDYNQVLLL